MTLSVIRTIEGLPRKNPMPALRLAFLLIFVSACSRDGSSQWPAAVKKNCAKGFNVLLITLDTTRADYLGCYGRKQARTPHLDALAARGIRFEDAVTVAPVTLPSHASILTGLYPPHHGARHNGEYHLADEHVTLAEILRNQGFATAAFVSAFVLDARFGLDQGFDLYDDSVEVARKEDATAFARTIHERDAQSVTSATNAWLSGQGADQPFFCWVHYFDPHSPYAPPPEYKREHPQRPYDGEIAFMDAQIGRIVQLLETRNEIDNTIIIVVADHGESLGEHGEATHSKFIYRAVMRVPLIVSIPGIYASGAVMDDAVVSVVDIFPTVLDLLGIPNTEKIDGESLLTGYAQKDRIVYMEAMAPYLDHGWSPLHGLQRHEDKYILAPISEYYDLRRDPVEQNNLFLKVTGQARASRDLLVTELISRMTRWPSAEAVAEDAKPLDAEALQRLESLGYVGTSEEGGGDASALPDPKEMIPLMAALDRATALGAAGNYTEALAILKANLDRSPRDRNSLFALAKLYLQMDKIKEAEETFRRSLSIRPSARVQIFLAQIMIAEKRLEEAQTILAEAEALAPNHGGIYLARGDIHLHRAEPNKAIAAYEQAKRIDPYRATAEADRRIKRLQDFLKTLSQP